jgi:uncharacterized protein YkwD
MHETNRRRVKEGVSSLWHDAKVDEAAVLHAKDMAENRYLSHEEPEKPKGPRRRMPIDRVRAVGLKPMLVAENIATQFGIQYKSGKPVYDLSQWGRKGLSYRPNGDPIPRHTYLSFARTVVDSWMASPAHRENILVRDARYIGSAAREEWPGKGRKSGDEEFHKFYVAQVFFTPMPGR